MTKEQITNHLGLALQSADDAVLRRKVEMLHSILTKPPRKEPLRTKFPPIWAHYKRFTTKYGWRQEVEVTVHREDAKFVEELWADYRSRRDIPGLWHTYTLKGKVKPIERRPDGYFTFKFYEDMPVLKDPDKKRRKSEGGGKKKVKKLATTADELMKQAGALSEADMLDLMRQMFAAAKKAQPKK